MRLTAPLAPLATAALLLGLTPALAGPAGATDPDDQGNQPPATDTTGTTGTTATDATDPVPEDLLDAPARGQRAIAGLDEHLPDAAAANDLSSADLRSLLREDPTAWVSTEGLVHYVDPAPDLSAVELADARAASHAAADADHAADHAVADHAAAADLDAAAEVSNPAAATDAFSLHSNPGASRTIFLDFGGAPVTGTAWNDNYGVSAGWHPAWDPAGDGSSFNDAERAKIAKIWAMVAEDYAPFGVDVTTEDPGHDRLVRTGTNDRVYGAHALITPSTQAWKALCAKACGGVAYLGTFDRTGAAYQPAWIFTGATADIPKLVAEAVSHEVGHNLALKHDGNGSSGYDLGHGAWAPIMGAGYYRPITQWSKGDYASADNRQDDVAILAGYLGRRADEAPTSPAASVALPKPGVRSYLTSRSDVDSFALGSCLAGGTVTVSPAATGANLDIGLTLRSGSGTVLAKADPASAKVDAETATGLRSVIAVPPGSGFTLQVDGVGHGGWSAGYDDYGSLGAYTVALTGCALDAKLVAPGVPRNTSAWWNPDLARAGTAWQPPTEDGGAEITGYAVALDGTHLGDLAASARVFTRDGMLKAGEHTLTVRAVNAAGRGPAASTTFTVPATSSTTVPRAPSGVSASRGDRSARVTWTAATSAGSPVTGYVVTASPGGASTTVHGAGSTSATVAGLTNGHAYRFTVRATSAAGASADSPASAAVTPAGRPDRPARPTTALRGDRLAVRWQAPAANGSAVSRYVVRVTGAGSTSVPGTRRRAVVRGLAPGRHRVRVVARNDVGTSRPSPAVTVRVRR